MCRILDGQGVGHRFFVGCGSRYFRSGVFIEVRPTKSSSGMYCPGVNHESNYSSVFTRNPNTSSKPVGTYLWSLFRRTRSFSSGELWYSSGEMFRALTTCSNELGEKTSGLIASGFVKLRFHTMAPHNPPPSVLEG